MSYLDLPRLHFSGQFFANPSTVNNTPNNYNANHQFPDETTVDAGLATPNNIDLFWNPNGDGTFGFKDCVVTKVTYPDGSEASSSSEDPVVGQSLNSNQGGPGKMAKIVDLDPMQQNVSELWGLDVSIGDVLSGKFVEAAFTGIWLQAKGIPPGDIAGSALYQSVLKDLTIADDGQCGGASSRFLQELAGRESLSICFIVRACNSSPQFYLVSKETVGVMNQNGVPKSETDKLTPLMSYASHPIPESGKLTPSTTPGNIPTESYFDKLLVQQLGQDAANQYGEIIKDAAKQPYQPGTPYDFVHGQVVGTIGPQQQGEPIYFTPARMLTPPPATANTMGGYGVEVFYAPFKILDVGGQPNVVINLSNSLPSDQPGGPMDANRLGDLRLCYFDLANGQQPTTDNAVPVGKIAYQDTQQYFEVGAGVVTLPIDADLENKPFGLCQLDADEKVAKIFLQENSAGYYLRADKFVFRMEPGAESQRAWVNFYVSQHGKPLAGAKIKARFMTPDEALVYTNNTPGTGGSPGVMNVSVPESAISVSSEEFVTDERGQVAVEVLASDPGCPRDYVDGQIYYLTYQLQTPDGVDYVQAPDDLISIQIYQQNPLSRLIHHDHDKAITWNNGVRDILAQYGKLYPIMSRFELGNYQSVKKNADAIRHVLELDMNAPLHMPVTRDMSSSRRNIIFDWMDNGMPE